MNRLSILALVLALAACAPPPGGPGPVVAASSSPALPSSPVSAAPDPTFQVTLQRTVCFGTCPAYNVTISADGKVSYDGARFVAVTGHRDGMADPAKLAALIALIDSSGFMDLKDDYAAAVTDMPSQIITVTRKGRTHRVRDYAGRMAGMPEDVSRIEALIDDAAGVEPWVGAREAFRGGGR